MRTAPIARMLIRLLLLPLIVLAGCGARSADSPMGDGGAGAPDLSPDGGDGTGASCPIHTRRSGTRAHLQPSDVTVQRGVDRAGVFADAEATTLASTYGVTWSGAYVGGACNGGSGWTPDRLTALAAAAGWSFLPIYVGQQSSAICGAHTLTYAAGNGDGNDAAAIMASYSWAPNTMIPVALDVEAGTYSADAAGTVAYVSGWLDAVHAAGYLAYVYSSPSALNAFAAMGLPIDGAWAASYFYSGFADVSPSDLTQLGGNFGNHDRAWQYAGDIAVAGAGRIDCDTSDLVLAPPPGGSNATGPAPPAPAPPTQCGRIAAGEGLAAGETLNSCNCRYRLTLQADGDLVLSSDASGAFWSAGIAGRGGAVAVMQADGNFVVYSSTSAPLWSTRSDGHAGAVLSVQDDGNLVVYDAGGAVLWASGTDGHP
jgi:hypothetical protein